ncbi:MAG: UvrD-helicase domain-containing protein [Lachnospiraceae bacterium]|nr:UvrD-helicase domain-containing protein [Candidatus Colinaster equi]
MGYLDTLNNEQYIAATTVDGPVLILAGAGSGKTRVLVHRIANMIDNMGVNPWNILAITFTNKAAGEMRERVDNIVGAGADSIWVSTFHSMCVRILRRHIDCIGYDSNFTIYDTDDQKSVMKDIMKRLEIDTKFLKERTVLSAISSAKDELIDPDEFEENCKGDYKKEQIAKLYRAYQETCKQSNALDFDDLIVKTVELFEKCPEVLNNYQERFRYICVDEYQDTNTAQFELIRLLADKYKNLCVVGDDDQSIYKFRGANISNILDFEKVYPDAKVIKLEQNYRSTQNILDAANAVIRNNVGRKDKSLWTDRGSGEKLHYRQLETAYEEADYIAADMAKAIRNGDCGYGDCAVLYRTNAQSRILEEAFVKRSMPYNVVGGVNFYSRKEIKDILAYLKTIDNAVDDVAVKRIINVPKRGIGQTTVNRVSDYALQNGIGFFAAASMADRIDGVSKAAATKLTGFVDYINEYRDKAQMMSIEQLIDDILKTTDYIDELKANEEDADERIENIDELISKAVSFEEEAEEVNLSSFLSDVALVADIDRLGDEQTKVVLMTLHGAKGLEFPRVYIAGAEDGVFPSASAIFDEDPTQIEEERRLAYVGITRAKDVLTITAARQRMLRGETQYNQVSRFVREIPEELLDNRPEKVRRMDIMEYDESSSERMSFKAAPFGITGAGSVYGMSRPKAVVTKKTTPQECKPYIAKTGLLSNAGIQKGVVKSDSLEYAEGDRVTHIKYGVGTVTKIESEPRDYKVTVDFDSAGTKIMYAAFAKLVKI